MSITSKERILELEVLFVDKFGSKTPGLIYVGKPYKDGDIWYCSLGLLGLDLVLPDIGGDTSLFSLCLALKVMRTRLSAFLKRGGNIVEVIKKNNGDVVESPFELNLYFEYQAEVID